MVRHGAVGCSGVAVATWAHGPGETGDATVVITDPPKPDTLNESLLPKSLNEASRGPASAVLA